MNNSSVWKTYFKNEADFKCVLLPNHMKYEPLSAASLMYEPLIHLHELLFSYINIYTVYKNIICIYARPEITVVLPMVRKFQLLLSFT